MGRSRTPLAEGRERSRTPLRLLVFAVIYCTFASESIIYCMFVLHYLFITAGREVKLVWV